MPAAELEITADLVRRLLAAQQPDLAGLPVEPLANGWDNTLFRLGDDLVARLPRRTLGARIVVNEQRWLPSLAPRLPLPVPVPVRTGVPGEGYPWPWSIVEFLPGTPASDGPPLDPRRAAADLGGFFGALHVTAPPAPPANPYRGVPLGQRAANFEQNLAAVAGQVDQDAVLAAWEAALAAPAWDGASVWSKPAINPSSRCSGPACASSSIIHVSSTRRSSATARGRASELPVPGAGRRLRPGWGRTQAPA
jgi:aminoglycoside phosphotransferase (APT) family kinase protein